jgi:uncharacterized membrane protein YphA (DoxX/SURF4 family)
MFTEESTASLAVVRVLTGLVILGWAVSVAPDVSDFFGTEALSPWGSRANGRWSLLEWWDAPVAAGALHLALVVAAVMLVIGWRTRLAGAVAVVTMLAFSRRNPWVFNSGDLLLRHLAFYAMLAPGGAALSVTAWRRHGTPWVFPLRPAWPRRLLQVQLSAIYLATVVAKSGPTWHDGTAVGYALQIEDLVRFATPRFLLDNLLLVNLMTFGTLAAELCLAVLIWNRRLRPWVLAVGVGLHLSIDLTLMVGFFSYAMIAMYVAFIDPDAVERVLRRLRARWRASPAPEQPAPDARVPG